MKKLFFFILSFFIQINFGIAQEIDSFKYTDGHELTVNGRAFNYPDNYHRLDSADRQFLINKVKVLASNSSGVNIKFRTNAKTIKVDWQLSRITNLLNMTPIAANGLDLYGMKNGKWQFIASGRSAGLDNQAVLVENLEGRNQDYMLYLPLYTEINTVKIGVPDSANIRKLDPISKLKRVVIYGTSITQGASASRAGMAYPAILDRQLNIETINLGFSGSGTMEPEIIDVLARISADAYILDCVPNMTPKMIRERTYDFISKLRRLQPGVPIILIESIIRETGYWDQKMGANTIQQNLEWRKAFLQAKKDDPKNLHYIPSRNLIGDDHEATIDGTHLTDIGFMRFAKAIEGKIKSILK